MQNNSYTLQKTSKGNHTLIYNNGNKEIRLHSAYNPEVEAERATADFSKGRSSFIAVSGLGLGYHVAQLKSRFPDTPVIVIEHDNEVIQITKQHYPEHVRGVLIITSSADLPIIFEQIDMADFRGVAHYIHRPSYLLYKDFYDSIISEMSHYISSKISDLLTRFEFEEKWVANILKNIPFVFSGMAVKELFGRFNNYPGIIVSAGPSLKKNVALLQQARDKAVIIAVDTSLKVLQKMGISPHIVMTLDAQKYSLKHFLGLKNHGSILLGDLVCYPAVIRTYQGKIMYSATSKYYCDLDGSLKRETTPLMDWVEQHIPPIGDIQSGGSVATSAFDLLLNLGCDPIILVGQDLAYTGREIHCSGTYHNDDWLTRTNRLYNLDMINQAVVRKRKIKHVEAYGGNGKVISDFVFDLYKNWFEDSANKVHVKTINATEGGARIKNTVEMSLSNLVNNFPDNKLSPDMILASLPPYQADKQGLICALDAAKQDIISLQSDAQSILANLTFDKAENIFDRIEHDNISKIFNPFLRKTRTYLARHDLGSDKICALYLKDIISAAVKIIPQLERCSAALKSI